MSELGNKCRWLRGELSQAEFAKKVGISHRTVTKIEGGVKPKRANILRIAEKLRLPPDERLEMLVLWLKSEVGRDFDLINPQPRLAPPRNKSTALHRLTRAAAHLTAAQQDCLAEACARPLVLSSLAALLELHRKVESKASPAD